jgi:hypothetical protein
MEYEDIKVGDILTTGETKRIEDIYIVDSLFQGKIWMMINIRYKDPKNELYIIPGEPEPIYDTRAFEPIKPYLKHYYIINIFYRTLIK